MDIWKSSNISNAYTTRPCTIETGGATRCSSAKDYGVGDNRYDGVGDKDGCDFSPYRMGNETFFSSGSGFTIDTTKKFTVVTRFITDDNTAEGAEGTLTDIKRFYVQDGVTHAMTQSPCSAIKDMNLLTDTKRSAAKQIFGDEDDHKVKVASSRPART
ncbi:hypothetical protein V7S43_016956 [Phytophthora oleae]|uniref:cellulose 1,4-beta-cellobiosidase (non-reducing end) n=1 Tax=Phytophthora oleae TaxID=2107226 RepID=A0ABD3EUJ4_9STRA